MTPDEFEPNINDQYNRTEQYQLIVEYLKDCFVISDAEIHQHISTTFPDLVPFKPESEQKEAA